MRLKSLGALAMAAGLLLCGGVLNELGAPLLSTIGPCALGNGTTVF